MPLIYFDNMSQITRVRFWKDVGFQDGSIEVPSIHDRLPAPDAEFTESIKTSTSEFFSAFTIPKVFADYLSMSYVELLYEYNNTVDTMTFYGWIDDIALKSDTDGSPSIMVSWHIDHWRTYLANARFGYGLVQNRPRASDDPPQVCSCRYRLPGDYTPMSFHGHGEEANWLIINHTRETDSNKLTEVRTAIIPISKDSNINFYYKSGDNAIKCPSLGDVITGKYDESLKMSPSSIASVFLSPVPPIAIASGTGTQTDPYVLDQGSSSADVKVTPVHLTYTDKLIMSYELLSAYQFRFTYTDGTSWESRSDIVHTIEEMVQGIMTRLMMDKGKYTKTSKTYPGNHTVRINCRKNGGTVSSMTARWIKLDDLITIARRGNIEDEPVAGDYVILNSGGLFSVPSEPSLSTRQEYTPSLNGDFYDIYVEFNHGAKTAITGNTYTYDGSSFGNVWVLITNIETVSLTYYQKVSSLKFQVEISPEGYAYSRNQNYYEYGQTLPEAVQTTDTREWMFTDMSGIPVGSLPWGIRCKDYTVRNVVTSSSAYLEYRFDGIDSHTKGTSFSIPLPAVDLTSNSWSDYVYSGQRDYDIRQRKLASEQALTSGIVSALTGGIDTAVMGALTNTTTTTNEKRNYAYGKESASESIEGTTTTRGIGGLRAGVVGIGAGVVGTGANYLITQYYNGELQKADDMLQAKQIDSILMTGNGWDWLWNGRSCGLISLVADNYSLERFETDIRLNGVSVSEPTEDCDTYRISEGPVRIAELIVTGNIPVQARAYIKGRMANGVRIRTINTEQPTE